jgi:hypothetical protein
MAYWLYLLSDEGGSWPVLKEEPLPTGLLLCEGKVLVELFGRYERGDLAWSAFRKLGRRFGLGRSPGSMRYDFEIVPDDRVVGIQRQCLVPVLHGSVEIARLVVEVADAGEDVITKAWLELSRAQVMLQRLVMRRAAVGDVAEVLVGLGQRGILVESLPV